VLLHFVCIGKRFDQGILISAPPDTGKTSTVLKCMEMGFSLLSDDMTILSLPNQALCFPKPMTISSHTYRTAVATSKSGNSRQHVKGLGFRVRSMIHSKRGRKMMRKLSNINVPFFTINAIGQVIFKPPKHKIDEKSATLCYWKLVMKPKGPLIISQVMPRLKKR
jgi:dolichol-phosphate mannosyltransferase